MSAGEGRHGQGLIRWLKKAKNQMGKKKKGRKRGNLQAEKNKSGGKKSRGGWGSEVATCELKRGPLRKKSTTVISATGKKRESAKKKGRRAKSRRTQT